MAVALWGLSYILRLTGHCVADALWGLSCTLRLTGHCMAGALWALSCSLVTHHSMTAVGRMDRVKEDGVDEWSGDCCRQEVDTRAVDSSSDHWQWMNQCQGTDTEGEPCVVVGQFLWFRSKPWWVDGEISVVTHEMTDEWWLCWHGHDKGCVISTVVTSSSYKCGLEYTCWLLSIVKIWYLLKSDVSDLSTCWLSSDISLLNDIWYLISICQVCYDIYPLNKLWYLPAEWGVMSTCWMTCGVYQLSEVSYLPAEWGVISTCWVRCHIYLPSDIWYLPAEWGVISTCRVTCDIYLLSDVWYLPAEWGVTSTCWVRCDIYLLSEVWYLPAEWGVISTCWVRCDIYLLSEVVLEAMVFLLSFPCLFKFGLELIHADSHVDDLRVRQLKERQSWRFISLWNLHIGFLQKHLLSQLIRL